MKSKPATQGKHRHRQQRALKPSHGWRSFRPQEDCRNVKCCRVCWTKGFVPSCGCRCEQAIHTEQPLQELGLDSLLSIELRNSVGISLHRSLPATLLFDYPTLRALTDYLLSIVGASEPARPRQSRAKPDRRSALDDIEALSDDEVNELLNQQTRTRQEV